MINWIQAAEDTAEYLGESILKGTALFTLFFGATAGIVTALYLCGKLMPRLGRFMGL